MHDEAPLGVSDDLATLVGVMKLFYDDDDLVWSLTCVWKPLKKPLDPHTWWSNGLEGMLKVLC